MNETSEQSGAEMVTEAEDTTSKSSETFFAKLVGINEAATITGRGKGQIARDANSKRLACTLNDKGQKRYKVADLFQLYGFREPKETSINNPEIPHEKSDDTTKAAVELAVLQERLRAQEETIQRMERTQAETTQRMEREIQDLRQSRDRLLDQNNRLTLLLPAPPATTGAAIAAPEPERNQEPPKRQPLWKRLFS
jgi:hypothetical protein